MVAIHSYMDGTPVSVDLPRGGASIANNESTTAVAEQIIRVDKNQADIITFFSLYAEGYRTMSLLSGERGQSARLGDGQGSVGFNASDGEGSKHLRGLYLTVERVSHGGLSSVFRVLPDKITPGSSRTLSQDCLFIRYQLILRLAMQYSPEISATLT